MPDPTIPTDDVDALVAHEWASHPRSAHRLHTYDSGCAICRGDVAAIIAVVAPLIAARADLEPTGRELAQARQEVRRAQGSERYVEKHLRAQDNRVRGLQGEVAKQRARAEKAEAALARARTLAGAMLHEAYCAGHPQAERWRAEYAAIDSPETSRDT